MKLSRYTSRQKHKPNSISLNSNNPVDYYRGYVCRPLFNNVLEYLCCRFLSNENKNIVLLMRLIPSYVNNTKMEDFSEYFKTVSEVIIGSYIYRLRISKHIIQNGLDISFTKWCRYKCESE